MKSHKEEKTTRQFLDEADELIRQINSDVTLDLKEEQRIAIEKHAQELITIKSMALAKDTQPIKKKHHTAAEGIHEAILDIVKATQNFKKDIL